MPQEPLIHWPDPLIELFGFVCFFLAAGAVGFRLAVWPAIARGGDETERAFARAAARRAAALGLIGIAGTAFLAYQSLAESAAKKAMSVPAFAMSQPLTETQVALLAALFLGFLLAAFDVGLGWILAALALLLHPLRAAFFGQLARVVNPVHELAGGLWIGTLFLMVFVGIAPALRHLRAERRGAVVQQMVNGFSPLALSAFALLVAMGLITAWRHLKRIESLWTTPYGWTLVIKLLVVGAVLGLGAWNWRRQKPRLGSETGAVALRGSATGELLVASIVLVITSILVSLPSPR